MHRFGNCKEFSIAEAQTMTREKQRLSLETEGDITHSTLNHVTEFCLAHKINLELLKGVGDFWEAGGCHIRFQI